MKNEWLIVMIQNIALYALIGFLCWYFKDGWPCWLVLFTTGLKTKE